MSYAIPNFAVIQSEKGRNEVRDYADFFVTEFLKFRQLPPVSDSESTDKSIPFRTVSTGQATVFC